VKRRKIKIVFFAEGDHVAYYTLKYDGEDDTEYDKFFANYDTEELKEDIDTIMTAMEMIAENGAEDRHFRYAGSEFDNAMELPPNMYSSQLRLYCLKISKNIVILGNGGKKETRTYQEDPWLDSCVKILQEIDRLLKQRIESREVEIKGKQLIGHLSFYI